MVMWDYDFVLAGLRREMRD